MPSSLTPGSSDIACVQLRDADAAFAEIRAARHSQHSRNPFHARPVFRGFTGSPLLRPVRLLAPLDGSDRVSPATGGFYIQASGGSVAPPAAGYDYNSNWTPLLAGLSPAGMAASLAAPDRAGLGGKVQRPGARGLDQPQAARPALETHRHASRGPAGHRRARAHSGDPRCGALAFDRPDRVALGGVPPFPLQADAVARVAGHERSQALGPSAPSRQERGRGDGF